MPITFLQHSYCNLSSLFFGPFRRPVHQPDGVHVSTFLQTGNHSWSCRTSILEDAIFHKMSCCKFFARPSRQSTTGTPSPGTSGSRCLLLHLLHERIRRRIRLCYFPRLFISWRKLQWSPFTHCPLDSHCQQSPRIPRTRCFVL